MLSRFARIKDETAAVFSDAPVADRFGITSAAKPPVNVNARVSVVIGALLYMRDGDSGKLNLVSNIPSARKAKSDIGDPLDFIVWLFKDRLAGGVFCEMLLQLAPKILFEEQVLRAFRLVLIISGAPVAKMREMRLSH